MLPVREVEGVVLAQQLGACSQFCSLWGTAARLQRRRPRVPTCPRAPGRAARVGPRGPSGTSGLVPLGGSGRPAVPELVCHPAGRSALQRPGGCSGPRAGPQRPPSAVAPLLQHCCVPAAFCAFRNGLNSCVSNWCLILKSLQRQRESEIISPLPSTALPSLPPCLPPSSRPS